MSRIESIRSATPLLVGALLASLTACGDPGAGAATSASATVAKSSSKPATSASSVSSVKAADAAPPSSSASPASSEELAGLVPADFEEEAERAITIENLDAELIKIEQEIHAK